MAQEERRDSAQPEGQPVEVQRVGESDIVKCIDFMAIQRVCVGDFVLVQTPRMQIVGCVKLIYSGGAMLIERQDGRPTAVRLKYVSVLEVLQRGGCAEPT